MVTVFIYMVEVILQCLISLSINHDYVFDVFGILSQSYHTLLKIVKIYFKNCAVLFSVKYPDVHKQI